MESIAANALLKVLQEVISLGEKFYEDMVYDYIEEPLRTAREMGKIPEFSVDNGATKAVILFRGYPYVIKIPFTHVLSEDWQECIFDNLKNEHEDWDEDTIQEYIEEHYDACDYIDEFNGAWHHLLETFRNWDYCELETALFQAAKERGLGDYFAKEQLLGFIDNHPVYIQDRVTGFYEHNETIARNDERSRQTYNKCTKMHCHCFETTWIADFFDIYGEEEFKRLDDFLTDYEIGDLRRANIGYINGCPILFDYAGYREEAV